MTRAEGGGPADSLDSLIQSIRTQFPFFDQEDGGGGWVYLDNAATTQKPRAVLDALMGYYTRYTSNIHRGLYELSEHATESYEAARAKIARFLGASQPDEVVFVRGATEGINLIASSWGRRNLQPGDEVLMSQLEHHANIVPWQLACESTGAKVRVIPMDDAGNVDVDAALAMMDQGRVKVLSMMWVSNALGVRLPVELLVKEARKRGIFTLVDGAQAVSHFPVNVSDLNCDAFVFSGHKLYGPTGIGVLWARASVLEQMPPYQAGGDMIRKVSFSGTTFAAPPARFEAGTPHIAGAIGLGAAVDWLTGVGFDCVDKIDAALYERCIEMVSAIPGLRRIGTSRRQLGAVSLFSERAHPSDIAALLSADRIAVRTGHHCAQPLMERLGIPGTVRISMALYNSMDDLDRLGKSLAKAMRMLG